MPLATQMCSKSDKFRSQISPKSTLNLWRYVLGWFWVTGRAQVGPRTQKIVRRTSPLGARWPKMVPRGSHVGPIRHQNWIQNGSEMLYGTLSAPNRYQVGSRRRGAVRCCHFFDALGPKMAPQGRHFGSRWEQNLLQNRIFEGSLATLSSQNGLWERVLKKHEQ